jgi:hypothetical protein
MWAIAHWVRERMNEWWSGLAGRAPTHPTTLSVWTGSPALGGGDKLLLPVISRRGRPTMASSARCGMDVKGYPKLHLVLVSNEILGNC